MNPEQKSVDKIVMNETPEDIFSVVKQYLRTCKIKPLSKKQLQTIVTLMDHREARAGMRGYNSGKNENSKNIKELKDSMLMTFQRLGDANAQMAVTFARILEKM